MSGDDLLQPSDAVLRRGAGVEVVSIWLIDGRPPAVIRLPLDADWFEEFRLVAHDDVARPVFELVGTVARQSPELGM